MTSGNVVDEDLGFCKVLLLEINATSRLKTNFVGTVTQRENLQQRHKDLEARINIWLLNNEPATAFQDRQHKQ
jgi:hypothetical protein